MSAPLIGLTGILVLFILLILRVPVWISLLVVGFFGNVTLLGWQGAFALAGTAPYDVASNYSLSVLPLFIVMGEVASESRLSGELFKAARVLVSGFRGGLAVATLAASALFGAVSGSSLANAATMTRMALPELRKAGYDAGLATGCSPPAAAPASLSRHRLFWSFMPRLPNFRCRAFRRRLGARLAANWTLHDGSRGSRLFRRHYAPMACTPWRDDSPPCKPWQFLALFVVTIGGIYAGVFSPTEQPPSAPLAPLLSALWDGVWARAIFFAPSRTQSPFAAFCS